MSVSECVTEFLLSFSAKEKQNDESLKIQLQFAGASTEGSDKKAYFSRIE